MPSTAVAAMPSTGQVYDPAPAGIELRPYQLEAPAAVKASWMRGEACIVALPTGCGKTITGEYITAQVICHRLNTGRSRPRTVWLGHRPELVEPPAATFAALWPDHAEHVGIVMAEQDDAAAAHVFASVPTLANERRLERLLSGGPFTVVVVDECHHSVAPSWARVIHRIEEHAREAGVRCFRLGLSATPWREGGA